MDEIVSKIINVLSATMKVLGILVIACAVGVLIGYLVLPKLTQFALILALGILLLRIEVEAKEGDQSSDNY